MLWRIGATLAALFATSALAAAPARPALAVWVSQNTDLNASQVVIVGPENIYSLEPLGPRLPTGEVVAPVRAEAAPSVWATAHGFQSWDAHALFDCTGGRMRVMRSATYSKPDRQGRATTVSPSLDWFSPMPSEPAAKLFAAACNPAFAWPLRGKGAEIDSAPPKQFSGIVRSSPEANESTSNAPSTTSSSGGFVVQVANGAVADGAHRALAKASRLLGPGADGFVLVTENSTVGQGRRYTALLAGFATPAEAVEVCRRLSRAGQDCFARRPRAPELVQLKATRTAALAIRAAKSLAGSNAETARSTS